MRICTSGPGSCAGVSKMTLQLSGRRAGSVPRARTVAWGSWIGLLVISTLSTTLGCAEWQGFQNTPSTLPAAPTAESPPPSAPAVAYQYPDAPPVLDAEGLRAFVGRFKYHVVLLDFWASWSQASMQEMPELARLQEQYVEDGFQVISCNLDEPSRWSSQTLPALKRSRANFPCVVIQPESKPGIRAWLNPKWSYDLPARFVIDGQGRVVAQVLSGTTLASAREYVRRALAGDGDTLGRGRLPIGAAALRGRLIDVRTGKAEPLAEVLTKPADADRLGEQLAELLAARVDPAKKLRIAVLPFPSSEDRHRAGSFGLDVARGVVTAMTRRGYRGLSAPEDVQDMFDRTSLTPMAVDFDPTVVAGRLACDYLVVGWVRGAVHDPRPQQSLAAEGAAAGDSGDTRNR